MRTFAFAVAATLASSASAQFTLTSYDVTHNFVWSPPAGTTVLPTVTGYAFQHVWIKDVVGPYHAWSVAPLGQNPGFDGFGRDVSQGLGAINIPENGSPPVNCIFGGFNIPPPGYHDLGCLQIISPNSNTFATACVAFDVFGFGIGTTIQGRIQSAGNAGAFGSGTRSYSFSSAGITIADTTSTGSVQWTPFMDSVAGSTFAQALRKDPIVVTVNDINGRRFRQTILDIDYSTQGGDTFSWANGLLTTDAQNARFHARIMAPGALNPGEILIDIQGGVVVNAFSSGSLGFIVPPPGTVTPFTIPLPNNLSVAYDASMIAPGGVADVTLDFLGGADAPAAVPPGPPCGSADFDCDGDTGTDADIQAFLACVGGLCPEPPCLGNADFDGDGDTGTDADIEAFFRVLGGGAC